jgi:formylglycine-generating enzyme required for sulfatase activity
MSHLHLPLALLLTLPLLFSVSGGRAPAVAVIADAVVEAVVDGARVEQGQLADTTERVDARASAPAPVGSAAGNAAVMPPAPLVATRSNTGLVRIPGGSFVPLFLQKGEAAAAVADFELDRRQVTRGEFLDFVRANPRWRRSQIKPIFADERYLADWPADLAVGDDDDARRPVTQVSWFAAKAYCEAQGARLPSVDEWEYAAAASETERDGSRDPAFLQWLLELYTRPVPRPLPLAGTGFRNIYGIEDLHGPVREWVLDYNTVMVSDDSRGVGARDQQLYCAAGAVGSTRTDDYAAFLRYTFRSGLNGRSTVDNLGFRCAGGR